MGIPKLWKRTNVHHSTIHASRFEMLTLKTWQREILQIVKDAQTTDEKRIRKISD